MAAFAGLLKSREEEEALSQARWYALYTCANHERRVAAELGAREIENFLPLYRSVRKWKDRHVSLDLPLFPGYVFVRMTLGDKHRVVQVPSVVLIVGFAGVPAPLSDIEMEILRAGLLRGPRAEPHPFLIAGRRVRITCGPFAGLQGVLKQKKSALRVVISLELIHRSLAVEVEAGDVELVPDGTSRPVSRCVRKVGHQRMTLDES